MPMTVTWGQKVKVTKSVLISSESANPRNVCNKFNTVSCIGQGLEAKLKFADRCTAR